MESKCISIREKDAGLEIALHIQPRARCSEIAGIHDGALKVRIAAPPVDDAANRAVVAFFSDRLGIPKSRIRIITGDKSRRKTLRVDGVSCSEFLARCSPK